MKATNIGFQNTTYNYDHIEVFDDETQFDTTDKMTLALCWFDFCKENGLITYIEEVEVD